MRREAENRGGLGIAVALVLLALLVTSSPALAAPPPNDNFASAAPTTPAAGAPASANGTNEGATTEPGEPEPGPYPGGASVWYRWQASDSTRIAVTTCGSQFDTVLGVFTGRDLSELSLVAADDDGCGGSASSVTFDANAGEVYRIAVHGWAGDTGTFRLNLVELPPTIRTDNVSVVEGTGGLTPAVFTIWLSHPVRDRVSVDYATSRIAEAAANLDFVPTSGTVVFAPGEMYKQIAVDVIGDSKPEHDERFFFDLRAATGGSIETSHARATILDDDPPRRRLRCGPIWCTEAGAGPVRMSSSGDSSEVRRTIPISKRGKGRVAMRVGPAPLGELSPGDVIESSAEVQVSVTCVERGSRCVGSRYRYSPLVAGKLILSPDPEGTSGFKVSPSERLRCSQSRPHRNHHCVLVFPRTSRKLAAQACPGCSLNLVLSARHRRAKPGNKLVIGSDAHGGIEQDRGRLNAIVISPEASEPRVEVARAPARRGLPVAARGRKTRKQVVYSIRLDELEKQEQLFVEAKSLIRTRHLPYGTFVGAGLVLSEGPGLVKPRDRAARVATLRGEISEKNGFNCTRGRSAHPNPCLIRKLGLVRMKQASPGPLYVNLVVELGARFGGKWRPGDRAKVLDRGWLRVRRYAAREWFKFTF